MFCHKCGNKTTEGAGFCHKCGAKLMKNEAMPHLSTSNVHVAGSDGILHSNNEIFALQPKHPSTVYEAQARYDILNKEQKNSSAQVALFCFVGALVVFGIAGFVQFLGDSSMFNMEYSLPSFNFVDTDRRYTGRSILVNFALANILFVVFWGGWLLTIGLSLFGIFSCYCAFVDISRNDVERKRTEAKNILEKDQDKAIKLEQEANELEAVLNALGNR